MLKDNQLNASIKISQAIAEYKNEGIEPEIMYLGKLLYENFKSEIKQTIGWPENTNVHYFGAVQIIKSEQLSPLDYLILSEHDN